MIEQVSQNFTLAIAIDYGRIHTQGQWYRYDATTDSLIPSPDLQPSLLHDPDREEDCELGSDRTEPF